MMNSALKDKNIIIGISGGIAAYKAADLTSRLIKEGARVKVVMTENALKFIAPLTFETLSGNPVYYNTFQRTERWEIGHISLAKWADVMVVVPATANIIAKAACGLADDLLSTTILAMEAKVFFAPAMNTAMYRKDIVQHNMDVLKGRGYEFIAPASGRLACGDWGEGKLASIEDIVKTLKRWATSKKDMEGMRVLVTAGPTREHIDPVRFLSNPSSGKMGYAIAQACLNRGAKVELISGPVDISPPQGANVYKIETAMEMYEKVLELYDKVDIVFKAAAVADYRPAKVSEQKIKKGQGPLILEMVRNPDILFELGKRKRHQILVGFAAETHELEKYAQEKLAKKNLDFILGNDVTMPGTGFRSETNQGILFCHNGESIPIPMLDKNDFANRLIDEVLKRIDKGGCHDE